MVAGDMSSMARKREHVYLVYKLYKMRFSFLLLIYSRHVDEISIQRVTKQRIWCYFIIYNAGFIYNIYTGHRFMREILCVNQREKERDRDRERGKENDRE